MDDAQRRRWPLVVGVGVAALVAVTAFVLVWFEPQKLYVDDRADDPVPVATGAPPATTAPSTPGSAAPADLAAGTFVSMDHETKGRVRILELADGSRVVRLEGLDTSNGPDLYLYLSPNPARGEEGRFDDDHLSLGRLKANLGDQNYDLPAGADLARFKSVVIWCDRFNSAFGAADLA